MFETMRSTMRSTVPVKEEFGYNRELTSLNLFVGEPENCDAPNALEPNVHASVMGRVLVARTVDLNREFVLGQVEIHDPVVRRVETLLETIGHPERSEEIPAQQFRRGGRLAETGDVDRVPLLQRELAEILHTRILTWIWCGSRGKKIAFPIARIRRVTEFLTLLQRPREPLQVGIAESF